MLVPKNLADSNWRIVDPQGSSWFRSPLDERYHLVYRFLESPEGAQPLSLFNLRRWLSSRPTGRAVRAQWWNDRLELAALDGTLIKAHAVHRAPSAEDAAYFALLLFDQLDWSGSTVPLFWEGEGSEDVQKWTQHFIAHWHSRSLEGVLGLAS